MSAEKTQLRLHLMAKRKKLSPLEVEEASSKIADRSLDLMKFRDISTAHFYRQIESHREISPTMLLSALRGRYPKATIHIGSVKRTSKHPNASFDLIIIPLLGFNAEGYRIGYGGGWYDAFLSDQNTALFVGLGYDWAEVEFQQEPHDVPLDAIITPSSVRIFSSLSTKINRGMVTERGKKI